MFPFALISSRWSSLMLTQMIRTYIYIYICIYSIKVVLIIMPVPRPSERVKISTCTPIREHWTLWTPRQLQQYLRKLWFLCIQHAVVITHILPPWFMWPPSLTINVKLEVTKSISLTPFNNIRSCLSYSSLDSLIIWSILWFSVSRSIIWKRHVLQQLMPLIKVEFHTLTEQNI